MFSGGRTNNQGPDADMSAVRASVGTAASQGNDLPEVQVVPLGQTEEAVATRDNRAPAVREHDRHPKPAACVNKSAIYP